MLKDLFDEFHENNKVRRAIINFLFNVHNYCSKNYSNCCFIYFVRTKDTVTVRHPYLSNSEAGTVSSQSMTYGHRSDIKSTGSVTFGSFVHSMLVIFTASISRVIFEDQRNGYC